MNPSPRQLRKPGRRGASARSVSVEALAERSASPCRRCARRRLLAEAGLLTRFHGGVRVPSSTTENIAYRQRQQLNDGPSAHRTRVAQAVPERLLADPEHRHHHRGHRARELLGHRGLRVITNNLNVAAILSTTRTARSSWPAAWCARATAASSVKPRWTSSSSSRWTSALIGISAIEADGTLRDFDYREVKVARAIIEHSREVWLAADHSKFNRPAMVELARLDQVDRCSPTQPPPEPFPALLAEAGVTLTWRLTGPNSRKPPRMTLLLALDQGTSSSRSIVFDAQGRRGDGAARVPPDLPAARLGGARPDGDLAAPSWPRPARRWPRRA
jgi:DeoR family glycerol-3-phosphate regulon repressor